MEKSNAHAQKGTTAQKKVTLKPPRKEYWQGIRFNTDVIVTFNASTKVVQV